MKKIILLIFLGAFFIQCSPKVNQVAKKVDQDVDFRSKAPTPQPAPEVSFGDYESFSLNNGLKVIVVENHKVPKVTMRLFIDSKPVSEGDKAGFIEFTGELLSRGSKNRTKAQLDEEIDFLGAQFSTFSKGFYISGLSRHADKMLELATDAIMNPVFPEDEFNKIKTQQLSALASAKEDPNAISSNVRSVLNFGKNHPYGELVTEESVNKITLDDCKNYYNNYFGANSAYLVFVGDINAGNAKELADKYFGKWDKKMKAGSDLPSIEYPKSTTVNFISKRGAVQSVVALTSPIDLTPNSPDLIKARVMNTLLGGFFRSRLNQNLREDHAYTYGIHSSLSDDRVIGEFNASASVRNEITDSAIYQIIYEFNKIRTEKVPQKELDLVKSVMTGNFGRALESPMTIANFALKTERLHLPKNFYHDYLKNLAKVTSEDVMEMANKYLKTDHMNIVVVGDKKAVADKLAKFGELRFYDVYGNKIVEKKSTGAELNLDQLFEKNINALGGQSALDNIKSVESDYVANIQGMEMKMWEMKLNGKKSAMKLNMMGQTMQSQVFDGVKGYEAAQGQKKPMEEADLKSAKFDSYVFPVIAMKNEGGVSLTGLENIDGVDYYIVEKKGDKQTTIYYFNAKTFLLDKEEMIMSANGMTQKMSFKISNYKNHDGVLIAEKRVMSGPMPMPIEFNLTKIQVNGEVDENTFKVD